MRNTKLHVYIYSTGIEYTPGNSSLPLAQKMVTHVPVFSSNKLAYNIGQNRGIIQRTLRLKMNGSSASLNIDK